MLPFMKVLAWTMTNPEHKMKKKKNCSQNMRTRCDFYVHLAQTSFLDYEKKV